MPPEPNVNYSIQSLQEWVGDKSILIVGNGPNHATNNADLIVRMNFGIQDGCDLWVDGMSYLYKYNKWRVPVGKYNRVIRLDKHARDNPKHPGYLLPKEEFNRMSKELGLARPTTGLMALWWFKEYFPDNEKTVTGFNGDYDRYTNAVNAPVNCVHDWPKERVILKEWLKDEIFRAI